MKLVLGATASLVAILHLPVTAHGQANFYEGKSLNFIISSAPGGGYDAIGRLVARHIVNHIPGKPSIVIRNMPGAGGIVAINHVYNVAPRDGTTIASIQNNTPFAPLLGNAQAKYDVFQFNWLGSPSTETGLLVAWHTSSAKTLADIRKRDFIVASAGVGATESFYAHLFNATLGTRMKLIVGYPSATAAFLAMQRGEVEGYPSIFHSSLMAMQPNWIKDGMLRVLLQFGANKEPTLGDTPFASDLVKDPDDRALVQVGLADLAVGRPFVAPPGVPPERVAILRTALQATFADSAFLSDAKNSGLVVNHPRTGDELARVVKETYQAPAAIIERLRRLHEPN